MTTSSQNKIFYDTANVSAKILNNDRNRKATTEAKESRQRSKHAKLDNSSDAAHAQNI